MANDTSEAAAREEILRGLTERARNLVRAFDRHDRLETAAVFVGWLEGEADRGRLAETTREVFLRALRVAGDPINFKILSLLDPLAGVGVHELMVETGLGRVAVSERVNDLVQVGLAGRELIDDQIRGTELTNGLVVLIDALSQGAAERLAAELSGSGGTGNG